MKAAHFKQSNGSLFDRYQCMPQSGRNREQRTTCGGCAASKAAVDTFVVNAYFDFMSHCELRPVDGGRPMDELQADLSAATERLNRLTRDHYVKGLIQGDLFLSTHQELSTLVDSLSRELDVGTQDAERRSSALVPGNREDLQSWWEMASLTEQRESLSKAIARITIQPAKQRGGNVFDTTRVKIGWDWGMYIRAADVEWEHMTEEERDDAIRDEHAMNRDYNWSPVAASAMTP